MPGDRCYDDEFHLIAHDDEPGPLNARLSQRLSRVNLVLAALVALTQLYLYFILPLLLAGSVWWALSLAAAVLATQPLWALIHEAIHGVLHPRAAANNALGRLLAVLFGAPFGVLRAGHLLHHRLNRSALDRSEVYEPRTTPRRRAIVAFYFRLLGGLYLAELACAALAWLPSPVLARGVEVRMAAMPDTPADVPGWLKRTLLKPVALWHLRLDGLLALGLIGASLAVYGPAWPWLAAALLGRGLVVSLLDNAFHYGTALDHRHAAMNFRLPRWAARLVLHGNLHGVHHRFPGLPWAALPEAFARLRLDHDRGFVAGCLRQLRGPIPRDSLPGAGATPLA